jgi:hypothetical protein
MRKDWLEFAIPLGVEPFDVWINRLAYYAGVWSLLDEPLQLYRRHGENASVGVGASVTKPSGKKLNKPPSRAHQDWVDLWAREIRFNNIYADRLEIISKTALGEKTTAIQSANLLRHKARILQDRLDLIKLPTLRRFSHVFTMLISGKYGRFQGLKSALGDLIR